MGWDPGRYEACFSIITSSGEPLLDLLDPQPGERVLDLGCGTGVLAAQIAGRGAHVIGLDADEAMVAHARRQHPDLDVQVADAHDFTVSPVVDAVFSNAALHWMPRQDEVLASVRRALRRSGRFVAEMGAAGNVAHLLAAVRDARHEYGYGEVPLPWYFPTPAQYAVRLERGRFDIRLLSCFDRPTPVDSTGIVGWLEVFGSALLTDVAPPDRADVARRAEQLARPRLWRDGRWWLDYRRLRFVAVAA